MTFYERVYQTAKNRGLSIKQLAQKMGVSDATIYTWKKTGAPTGKNLTLVSKTLGVSVDYLLGNTDETRPTKKNPNEMDSVELDKALRGEGASLQFEGKELSDEYKRMILDILQNLK